MFTDTPLADNGLAVLRTLARSRRGSLRQPDLHVEFRSPGTRLSARRSCSAVRLQRHEIRLETGSGVVPVVSSVKARKSVIFAVGCIRKSVRSRSRLAELAAASEREYLNDVADREEAEGYYAGPRP